MVERLSKNTAGECVKRGVSSAVFILGSPYVFSVCLFDGRDIAADVVGGGHNSFLSDA